MANDAFIQTERGGAPGETELSPELIAAYRATDFRVLGPQAFTLRVGVPSVELLALYAELSVTGAGFITAWNPWSEETDRAINDQAQVALLQRLRRAGYDPRPGLGADPDGRWPGEESWFVPAISRTESISLGREFRQNAVIWAGDDAVPQLILLR